MVYVDELKKTRIPGGFVRWRYVEYCHMFADTLDELHAFAKRLRLNRSWFHRVSTPHYDLTCNKRAFAVRYGAQEVKTKDYFRICAIRSGPRLRVGNEKIAP